MILNKVLANSRHVLTSKTLPLRTAGETVRQTHYTAVPARGGLTGPAKLGLGVLMFVSMWFTPFWVLYHIPDYQNEDRNKYTGK